MIIQQVDQQDPRLGRQLVHDARSLNFPMKLAVDKSQWKTKTIRLYDPLPNPDQPVGCCTGVAKASQFNAVGNRVTGEVLSMKHALLVYSVATTLDPWEGAYPPEDTGSSGLASAQAAQRLGWGGEYRWFFGGADEVVQGIMLGEVVSVGTWWHWDMFAPDASGRLRVSGGRAGGHQYVVYGYDAKRDWVKGRCWWGPSFRDFWLTREDLNTLLMDDGDAHWQKRLNTGA